MRISTSTIYEAGIGAIQQQQNALLKTQQQIASGKRVLTPSDDPVAAARVLEVSQSLSTHQQFAINRKSAATSLGLEESALSAISEVLQDARIVAVSSGNPALGPGSRFALAEELRSRFEILVGLANSTDGNGQYLFSGFQGTTQPFSGSASGAVYSGDQGQRLIQISDSRQLEVSDSGSDVFERIRTGNGVFSTSAAIANTGTGIISPGSVVNTALLTGHSYQINFTVATGVTTFA
ncbi:MAG: flagellar hook-associated protein FlgL, partial [Burkholderiales bacterium]